MVDIIKLNLPELAEVLEKIEFLSASGRIASKSSWGSCCTITVLVCGLLSYLRIYVQLYNVMAAASLAGTVPIILLVVFAQDKILSGLTRAV
jgi:ABC-type maltose transport system permease subunit